MSIYLAADTAGQFVPLDNFKSHQRQARTLPDFNAFLQETCAWVEWENKADETRRHRKWVRAAMFYEGRQLGRFSGRTGAWRDIEPLPQDPYYVDNKYRFMAKSVRKEWVRSQAEMLCAGRNTTQESDGAARFAKAVLQAEQQRIWTPFDRQREANFAINMGNYFRYTFINPEKGKLINIPQFATQQMMVGQQALACADCNSTTPVNPDPTAPEEMACPGCGSPNVMPMGGQMMNVPTQVGSTQQPSGQIVCEVVDPMEIKMHLHARDLFESPYVRRKRMVIKDLIEATYPWVEFAIGGPMTVTGIWHQNELERSPGNASGSGGYYAEYGEGTIDRFGRMVEFDQFWLDPVLYATYTVDKDLPLANGETIPASTLLTEIFPDGMYIAKIGDAIVDIRNEDKCDHWVHGVYDLVSTRIWGDGNEDAIEQQRQHNEIGSLIFENIMHCDGPSTVFNPLKISRTQFSGKPREMVPLKNPTLADEPQKYIWQPNGRPLPSEVFAYRQALEQSMQSAFGAFNAVNGLPDADNKTATGISIVRDAATSLLAVPLELKAYVDMIHAKQILKFVQKNWHPEIYMELMGEQGQHEAEWFSQCDIDTDLEITVREHSWMPRNELELRNDMLEALTAGGFPGGVYSPMFPPDARQETMKRLNVPYDSDKQRVDTKRQYLEIQQILAACGVAQQFNTTQGLPAGGIPPMPMDNTQAPSAQPQAQEEQEPFQQQSTSDSGGQSLGAQPNSSAEAMQGPSANAVPMTPQVGLNPLQFAMQQVPVEPLVDEHAYHIEEIRRWLKTDRGEQLAPAGSIERQALLAHLEAHMQAQMMVGMQQAQMQMMAGGGPPAQATPPPSQGNKNPEGKKSNNTPPQNGGQGK